VTKAVFVRQLADLVLSLCATASWAILALIGLSLSGIDLFLPEGDHLLFEDPVSTDPDLSRSKA
jgi:hypothetical protein